MAALLQTQLNLKNSPELEKFWWKGKTQEDTILGNFSHSKNFIYLSLLEYKSLISRERNGFHLLTEEQQLVLVATTHMTVQLAESNVLCNRE